jgi:hypothetical protein
MLKKHLLSFVITAAFTAAPAASFAAGAADKIAVTDPYVRLVPPGQKQTGAYLLLRNADSAGHALVKADSPAADTVELHTVVWENGVNRMRPVPKMDVAASGETQLKPGAFHIMLIGLKRELKEGDMVSLTLGFEDGSSKTVNAPVRPVVMKTNAAHSEHSGH